MNWETLMSLGDSITIGSRSYGGYPEYAGNILSNKIGNNWNVVNHAVCGYTAMDLARSLSPNVHTLKQHFPGIISILIGTNDLKTNTSAEDFTIAYEQVIIKALLIAPYGNVVLIKLPYFPANVAYPYNFSMNTVAERFNKIIETLAREYNLKTLEFKLEPEDFFDGVHLNSKGSKSAGEQLAYFIANEKGMESKSGQVLTLLKASNE
jgi:lysophospholipase L1-like esterase